MAITLKTITGKIVIPGTTIGIRVTVTATPMTSAQALTFPADDVVSWGPVVATTDASGVLPASFKIPTSSEQQAQLLWKFTAVPVDKHSDVPKSWLMGHYSITGTGTIDLADLVDVDVSAFDQGTFVTLQSLVASASASATAAASSATSAAASASVAATLVTTDLNTTDGQSFALVTDPNSLTRGALDDTFVSALGIYQPEKFGAVGDNSTDNAAALAACYAAVSANGGNVVFGPGVFRTSGTITINANNVHTSGVLGSTIIRTTSATAHVFDFGDNVTLRSFLGIENLRIDSTVARTAGAFVRARKTADLNLTRMRLDGAFYGVDLLDAQITRLTDLHIINCTPTTGEAIRADSTGTGSNLYLTRVGTDAPVAAQPRCGLSVKRWDGVFMTDTQFNHSGTGCILEPPTGQTLDHIFAVNCSFDSGSGDGLKSIAGGGTARRAWFLGCWFGSNDNSGVNIDGAAEGFTFVQPKLMNNGAYGLILTSGTYLTITDAQISGNSRGASGTCDGILINDNMSRVTITGGLNKPFAGFPNTQRRGITINPGASEITVRDMDCAGNVNAVGIDNLSTADVLIRNARGYKNTNKGTATQLAASTGVGVTHGLDVTPGLEDIRVTPCSDIAAASKYYISNVTASGFDINTVGAPGANLTWAWEVEV